MLGGLLLLAGSTVFLCLSRNLGMLMAGRVLQGLSAALTWTVGLALVTDSVDTRKVGQAMGWVGMSTSIGLLIAPLLGGVVYRKGGYYAVFAMCFGIIAVDIVLRLLIIEVKVAKKWLDDEPRSTVQGGQTVEAATLTPERNSTKQNEGSEKKEDDIEAGTIVSDRQTPTTTSPGSSLASMLRLFRNIRLLAAFWGTTALAIFQTSFDSTLPLLVSSLWGWNSIGAGLVYLPIVLPCFISPLVGIICDKYGAKWLSAGGYFMTIPFLICLRFVDEDTLGDKVLLCAMLFMVGVGAALVFGPLMAEITWAIEDDEADREDSSTVPYATAYGLFNMAFQPEPCLAPSWEA